MTTTAHNLGLASIGLLAALTAGCAAVEPQQGANEASLFGAMIRQPQAAPAAPMAQPMVPAPSPRSDIRIMNSFQAGATTVTDAVRVLGTPTLVNHAPDGRFVYMYDFPSTPQGPMVAGMLFGPDQKLVKVDFFAKSPTPTKAK
jgi:hypothetical protein